MLDDVDDHQTCNGQGHGREHADGEHGERGELVCPSDELQDGEVEDGQRLQADHDGNHREHGQDNSQFHTARVVRMEGVDGPAIDDVLVVVRLVTGHAAPFWHTHCE